MPHSRMPQFDPGLYVTQCRKEGEEYFFVVHREGNPHKPHSRIDIPIPEDVARYYESHFKQYENNPRIRVRLLTGHLELISDGGELVIS